MVVDTKTTRAAGFAERLTAVAMVDDLVGPEGNVSRWARTGPMTRDFVSNLRDRCVTPHVAQNTSGQRSAIDGHTTRHAGYAASRRISAAGQGKTRFRGLARGRFAFTLTVAAYNLI